MCPACGCPDLDDPPRSNGSPSDEICFSCGFQFGYTDDARDYTYEQWREEWVRAGMPWRGRGKVGPQGWDPSQQLANLAQHPGA